MGTVITAAVLAVIVGLVVFKIVKDKKAGKGSCSCGGSCGSCPGACHCHPTKHNT